MAKRRGSQSTELLNSSPHDWSFAKCHPTFSGLCVLWYGCFGPSFCKNTNAHALCVCPKRRMKLAKLTIIWFWTFKTLCIKLTFWTYDLKTITWIFVIDWWTHFDQYLKVFKMCQFSFGFYMEEWYDAWLNSNIWPFKVSHLLNLNSSCWQTAY